MCFLCRRDGSVKKVEKRGLFIPKPKRGKKTRSYPGGGNDAGNHEDGLSGQGVSQKQPGEDEGAIDIVCETIIHRVIPLVCVLAAISFLKRRN